MRFRVGVLAILVQGLTVTPAASSAGDDSLYGPTVADGGVLFRYRLPGVSSVLIAADFTGWQPQIRLMRESDGESFSVFVPVLLKKRAYRYRLVIDGIWQRDPSNPQWEYDKAGNQLSLLDVPVRMIVYDRNPEPLGNNRYRFWFRSRDAEQVMLVGTFNGFDPFRTRMRRDPNGVWSTVVQVLPGLHHYCYVVDGEWQIDPESKETIRNRFGQEFSRFRAE